MYPYGKRQPCTLVLHLILLCSIFFLVSIIQGRHKEAKESCEKGMRTQVMIKEDSGVADFHGRNAL